MALDADPLERHITGRTVMVTGAAASMGFLLPFANFILDTTFTLFRRLIRREKWYQAHRSHVYQRMTDLGMACIPASPAVRIALVASVTAGIACGGLWIRGKEKPQNRDVPENSR